MDEHRVIAEIENAAIENRGANLFGANIKARCERLELLEVIDG